MTFARDMGAMVTTGANKTKEWGTGERMPGRSKASLDRDDILDELHYATVGGIPRAGLASGWRRKNPSRLSHLRGPSPHKTQSH